MKYSKQMHLELLSHKGYMNDKYNNYGMYQAPYPMPLQEHILNHYQSGQRGSYCPMDLSLQPNIKLSQTPSVEFDPSIPSFAFKRNSKSTNINITGKAISGQKQLHNSNNNPLEIEKRNELINVKSNQNLEFSVGIKQDELPQQQPLTEKQQQQLEEEEKQKKLDLKLQLQEQKLQQERLKKLNETPQIDNIPPPMPQFFDMENAFPLRDVNLALAPSNEDQLTKILMMGPSGRPTGAQSTLSLFMFGVNLISFIVIPIFGFVTCDPFKYDTSSLVSTFTLSSTLLMKGVPAVAGALGASFIVAFLLELFMLRATFRFLYTLTIFCFCCIQFLTVIMFIYNKLIAGFCFGGVSVILIIYILFMYQKLQALDQVAKMAYQFSVEMSGQFCVMVTFLIILVAEMAFLFFGFYFLNSKLTLDGFAITIDPLYQALSWIFVLNSIWLMGTTLQMYKFAISYMCCKWYFCKQTSVGLIECLKQSFSHLGSLTLSSLLSLFLSYITSSVKMSEKFFRLIHLSCAADELKTCRKSVDILVSSLTIVRIAHEGSDFCASTKSIQKQLETDPFYFLFVLWGADLLSSFMGFLSFWSGMITSVFLLYYIDFGIDITSFVLTGFSWVVCSKISDMMEQSFSMVLYSIGAYYNLCDNLYNKSSSEITNPKFFQMRDKIATGASTTNLQSKDIS